MKAENKPKRDGTEGYVSISDIVIANPEFKSYKLNDSGVDDCHEVAVLFDQLLNDLVSVCEPGREFSIVKTKLEEACFFAKKSVALDPANQVISS